MIQTRPAQLSSLADVLSDDGAVVEWRKGGARLAASHIWLSDAWQVEVEIKGQSRVVAVGGFRWREDLESAEAWFRATSYMSTRLREAISGVVMVLMQAKRRYGAVCAAVREGAAKSQRLVALMGFEPSDLIDGEYRYYRFDLEVS